MTGQWHLDDSQPEVAVRQTKDGADYISFCPRHHRAELPSVHRPVQGRTYCLECLAEQDSRYGGGRRRYDDLLDKLVHRTAAPLLSGTS